MDLNVEFVLAKLSDVPSWPKNRLVFLLSHDCQVEDSIVEGSNVLRDHNLGESYFNKTILVDRFNVKVRDFTFSYLNVNCKFENLG